MSGAVHPVHTRPVWGTVSLCLLLLPSAFAAGLAGAVTERRWMQETQTPVVPRMVSLDVAALLGAMARDASSEERTARMIEALQKELHTLTENEIVVLNAAAVVAGTEDLTSALTVRLLSTGAPEAADADE